MEQNPSNSPVANDVLHNDDHAKLTSEQVAKALAHHNKRHGGEPRQNASAKNQQGKKQAGGKPK